MKNMQAAAIAEKYKVSIPQLGIRYCLQLELLPLPKTVNPKHMKINADVDFVIAEHDMDILKNMEQIKNYGEFSKFPVFGGRMV
jgi:diketogulonate reductase-like aldo/keto reductase